MKLKAETVESELDEMFRSVSDWSSTSSHILIGWNVNINLKTKKRELYKSNKFFNNKAEQARKGSASWKY